MAQLVLSQQLKARYQVKDIDGCKSSERIKLLSGPSIISRGSTVRVQPLKSLNFAPLQKSCTPRNACKRFKTFYMLVSSS